MTEAVPRPPDEQDVPQPAGRLESWKEIAAYLNRGVRTVQRWERTEALPVYRHHHDKRGTVYAFRHEIDAWRESRSAGGNSEPDSPLIAGGGESSTVASVLARAAAALRRLLGPVGRTRLAARLAALILFSLVVAAVLSELGGGAG
jgi:hypothetical protein